MEQPYIKTRVVTYTLSYNPEYGDDRICTCGCSYYRHFDTWEDMQAVGCKYCWRCKTFKEAGGESLSKDSNAE